MQALWQVVCAQLPSLRLRRTANCAQTVVCAQGRRGGTGPDDAAEDADRIASRPTLTAWATFGFRLRQRFLATAAGLAESRRLSRFLFVVEKPTEPRTRVG